MPCMCAPASEYPETETWSASLVGQWSNDTLVRYVDKGFAVSQILIDRKALSLL